MSEMRRSEKAYTPAEGACDYGHRFFVATDGTIEGQSTVKIYAVVVCTACKETHLIEHILLKDAARLTK